MRIRYVWRDGHFRDRATGEPMGFDPSAPIAVPMVTPTMPEYASPIDGRIISTRHERREDMKRNNCVGAGDAGLSPTGGKFKNKAFCAKRGFQVSEEYR
jgi:hypothetical protein